LAWHLARPPLPFASRGKSKQAVAARKVHRDTMGRECGRTQATGPNKNARRWAIWLRAKETPDKDAVLYLIAKGGPTVNKGSGDNPAIVLLTVLGGKPPAKVTINELTTVASAFTTARFINGESMSGNPLGLRIAAGNVPNLVDPATGGWGKVILDPINSTQTTTLANLDTLGSLITAFATVADDNWRARFLKAATPTDGATPKNTLEAMAGIAREPWADPKDLYTLFDEAYPQPKDGSRRAAPFVPYLAYTPPDFALMLCFAAAGCTPPPGSCSMWMATSGAGRTGCPARSPALATTSVAAWSSSPPNGTALSPAVTGFTGMGLDGVGWGPQ